MNSFVSWLEQWTKPEIIWFILGLLLIIFEFASPGFIIIFFGFGAVLTAILCMIFSVSLNGQLLIFIIFSITSLVVLRRYFKKIFIGKFKAAPEDIEFESEYIGRNAVVVSKIEPNIDGKIELDGSNWNATSTETLEVGQRVRVVAHKNLTMEVEPIN